MIALFYSCFAFAFTLTEFSGIDISKIKDANQLVCFSQSNRLWFFFSLLYPFLLVLPFSTSYIDDYKNQLLPVYISRTSRTIYYVSKLVASFLALSLLLPFHFSLTSFFAMFFYLIIKIHGLVNTRWEIISVNS